MIIDLLYSNSRRRLSFMNWNRALEICYFCSASYFLLFQRNVEALSIFFHGSLFSHQKFLEYHAFIQIVSSQSILFAYHLILFLYFHSRYSSKLISSFYIYFESINLSSFIIFNCSFKKSIDSKSILNPSCFVYRLNFCISKMEHF